MLLVRRPEAAAAVVDASLRNAGLAGVLASTPEGIRQGLQRLVGKLIMIPGKVNKRSNKATGEVELGPVNLERTKEVDPVDSDKFCPHPVAFHPLVWTLKDCEDDHCLALLLPVAEEGYNLPGEERVRHLTLVSQAHVLGQGLTLWLLLRPGLPAGAAEVLQRRVDGVHGPVRVRPRVQVEQL